MSFYFYFNAFACFSFLLQFQLIVGVWLDVVGFLLFIFRVGLKGGGRNIISKCFRFCLSNQKA